MKTPIEKYDMLRKMANGKVITVYIMKHALTRGIVVVNATYDKEFSKLCYTIGKRHFKITIYEDDELEPCEFSEKLS